MARTPLFPRHGDLTSWALNITQRIERDYAELKRAVNLVSNTASFLNTMVVNVKSPDYGAVGDGAANDTTAVATALTAAKNKILYIPPGTYRMENAVTLTGGVSIVGAGMGSTQLRWSTLAASSGIVLFGTAATYNEFHRVENISLLTGAANTGTALTFDYSAQVVSLTGSLEYTIDRYRIRFYAENVECMGTTLLDSGDVFSSGWAAGIHSVASPAGTMHNVAVTGQASTPAQAVAGSHGIYHEGSPAAGYENGHPVLFIHDKCFINFCDIGIAAYNCEGVYITNCNAVACNYGYYVISSLNVHPQVTIIGCHANSYNDGILVIGQQQIAISDNLIYCIQTATVASTPIYIQSSSNGVVHGNVATAVGTTTSSYGIIFDGCTYLNASDNIFLGPYVKNGIGLTATSNHIKGSDNNANAITGKTIEDLGTDNRINERVEAGTRQFDVSVSTGQLVTISFSTAFDNVINSVVANPMSAGAISAADDWIAIDSYSLGGFIARYNTTSASVTKSVHFMAFGH